MLLVMASSGCGRRPGMSPPQKKEQVCRNLHTCVGGKALELLGGTVHDTDFFPVMIQFGLLVPGRAEKALVWE